MNMKLKIVLLKLWRWISEGEHWKQLREQRMKRNADFVKLIERHDKDKVACLNCLWSGDAIRYIATVKIPGRCPDCKCIDGIPVGLENNHG